MFYNPHFGALPCARANRGKVHARIPGTRRTVKTRRRLRGPFNTPPAAADGGELQRGRPYKLYRTVYDAGEVIKKNQRAKP